MSKGFEVDLKSLDGSANLLLEIAGVIQAGRLDKDLGTLARTPHAHPEVGAAVEWFARFAADQYEDLALLLTALSTVLKTTRSNYTKVDNDLRDSLLSVLDFAQYEPPRRATA